MDSAFIFNVPRFKISKKIKNGSLGELGQKNLEVKKEGKPGNHENRGFSTFGKSNPSSTSAKTIGIE